MRRVTLRREGEEDIIPVTDLEDTTRWPAADLLAFYLACWGIECVFQEITEVFHVNRLIGTTPQGTLFQLSFCLLLYNMIQVVRGYVAAGRDQPVETISTELLFEDVVKQLVALTELVSTQQVVALLLLAHTVAEVRQCLRALLGTAWKDEWLKATPRKRKPPGHKQGPRNHTSVYRLLNAYSQARRNLSVT